MKYMRKYITSTIAALITLSCFHGQLLATENKQQRQVLIENIELDHLLSLECGEGNVEKVENLIHLRANVNVKDQHGMTPLM